MPQPLRRVYPRDARQRFGVAEVLAFPGLVAHIHTVTQIWAYNEAILDGLLANFLEADFKVVRAMTKALTGAEGKRAAITAAGRLSLSEDDFSLFEAVMKVVRPSRQRRNDFVHHLWGVSPDIPGALLLLDPQEIVEAQFAVNALLASHRAGRPQTMIPKDMNPMVYFEKDLVESATTAAEAADLINQLAFACSKAGESARTLARIQLKKDPRIQRSLAPQSPEGDR
jgi:hypothetical protein